MLSSPQAKGDDRWNDPRWGTHIEALVGCLQLTAAPILEVGMGWWSTPLLHIYSLGTGRHFVSVDEGEWAQQVAAEFPHRVVAPAELPALAKLTWGVVLVDNQGDRQSVARMFANSAEFVVVHDYDEQMISDQINPILHLWKSSRVYGRQSPSTLVLTQYC